MTAFWDWLAAPLAALVILLIIALALRKRRKRRGTAAYEPPKADSQTTVVPPRAQSDPPLLVANLQGVGAREEQQDAFRISPLCEYEEYGLLAILCDGMGGLADGGAIARHVAERLALDFPMSDDTPPQDVAGGIERLSGEVYAAYRGEGGSTLILAYLRGNKLLFWCVGDSDLFLYRDRRLYAMNRRHEYINDLLESGRLGTAWDDPQAGALSAYIGINAPACDYTRAPFALAAGDELLLCSDGVSDTLSLAELAQCLALPPEDCCAELEKRILAKQQPEQDNYSAIIIKYNGTNGGTENGENN